MTPLCECDGFSVFRDDESMMPILSSQFSDFRMMALPK